MKHSQTLKKITIQTLIQKGKLERTACLLCYWNTNDCMSARVAIAVTKKIKHNYQKNLVKRQLRIIITQKLNWVAPINYFFIAKQNYFSVSFNDITNQVASILIKIQNRTQQQDFD